MNNLPPNSPMNPSIPLMGNQGSFLPPVLPPPHQGKMQPIDPRQVQAGFNPSPMETLAIRVVLVAAGIFGALALLAVCAAMGPAGYAIAAVITGAAVTYMISKNVFGSRDFLVKVGNFATSKFLAMKTAVQNRLNPPPAPPVAPIALQENAPVDVASKVQAEGATEHRTTKDIHSGELTRIYQAHLEGDLEKIDGFVKQESIQNGVTRVRYIDPATNVVEYEFNHFEPVFYNGPSRVHFEDRLTLIAETLEHNLPEDAREGVRSKFEEYYKEQLKAVLGVDEKLITGDETFNDENRKPLEEKFEAAKRILQEAFENASQLVSEHVKDANFTELEKHEVVNRGRPVIINTFQVPGDSKTYFSAQKPLLDTTIPSSIRNQEGLCNAVMTFTGFVGEGENLCVLHEASRHSSIPPIAIEDPVVRQQISVGNAMQELEQLVFQKVGDRIPIDNARDNPIELDWNNMILMTPKAVDNARNRAMGLFGTWKGEGETLMLKESIRALYYYSNRPVEVDVGGQKVWVKLNVSAMNLGCNTAALSDSTLGRIPNARTLNGLNAQGFMEFEIQTDHFIIDLLKDDPELSKLYNEYCQLKEYQHNRDFFEVKNQINQAVVPWQEQLQNELAKDTPDKNRINDLNNQIQRFQKSLRKQAKTIYAKKMEAYKTRGQEIEDKRGDVIALIKTKIGENEENQLAQALLVLTNQAEFARSLKDGEHQRPDTIMRSQAIYIETMSLMNNWVSFFCKSGEDRTGAVDIETAARVISKHGGGEEKDAKITLFETSISRQVTRENSNSEGMQISPLLVPEEIRLKIWLQSKIAKLAKGVTNRDVGLLERVGNVFRGRQSKPWEIGEMEDSEEEVGLSITEKSNSKPFSKVVMEIGFGPEISDDSLSLRPNRVHRLQDPYDGVSSGSETEDNFDDESLTVSKRNASNHDFDDDDNGSSDLSSKSDLTTPLMTLSDPSSSSDESSTTSVASRRGLSPSLYDSDEEDDIQ